MKRALLGALTALALPAVPAEADAATWRSCSVSSATVRQLQTDWYAVFSNLRARSPMNCASARYAVSHVRGAFRRPGGGIPRTFDDGYVTWHGRRISTSRSGFTVQYTEYDSGTAFRVRIRFFG
jgi:hypothetical protein